MDIPFADLIKSKFDYYTSSIGLLMMVGGVYVYLNYFSNVLTQERDFLIFIIIIMSLSAGFIFFYVGFLEMYSNYNKESELLQLSYEIKHLKLSKDLKDLKKQYNIVEPEKELILQRIKKWICEKCCQEISNKTYSTPPKKNKTPFNKI